MYKEPSWSNLGWLLLDAGAAVVPFVPAVGAVRHATKLKGLIGITDKATDAAKAADKATDATKSAKKIHGNSLDSPKKTTLYQLKEKNTGKHLKFGVTSQNPMQRRYTKKFMSDKRMDRVDSGGRRGMVKKERELIRKDPGPLNKERYLKKADDQ